MPGTRPAGSGPIFTPDGFLKLVLFGILNEPSSYDEIEKFFPSIQSGAEFTADGNPTAPTQGNILTLSPDSLFLRPDETDEFGLNGDINEVEGVEFVAVPYRATEHGLMDRVADLERIAAAANHGGLNTAEIKLAAIANKMRTLSAERKVTILGTPANWDSGAILLPAEQWTQKATSNPVDDLLAAVAAVSLYGRPANAILLSHGAAEALRVNPAYLDNRSDATDKTIKNYAQLAEQLSMDFGLTMFGVVQVVRNTSAVDGTLTPAYVGGALGEFVWVGHIPQGESVENIEIGEMTNDGDGQFGTATAVQASATYRLRAKDWVIESGRVLGKAADAFTVTYAEAAGPLQTYLGYVISNVA